MDEEGNNAVHIAAANGYDLPSSSFNIEDINCQNSFGWTPLMYSAYHGHELVVNKLLSFGADVTITNDFGASTITLAAASGKADVVRSVMEAEKITSEFDFASPLAIASVLGHLTVTRYLIDHGFDPNSALASSGVTPLMLAVSQNHVEVVKLLIERDVCITSINMAGYSALDLAVLKGNKEIISVLHGRTGKYLDINLDELYTSDEEMSLAAKTGNLLSLRNQLSKNFFTGKFNQKDVQNFSKIGDLNKKKYTSPNPEISNYSGAKRRNIKFIKNSSFESLNEISMQINGAAASDYFEETSRSKTINSNCMIKDVDAIEYEKVNNALMAACKGGHMQAVYLLIAAGADPNYEQEGQTPLMVAVAGSHLEITKLLLSVGADPQQMSSKDSLTAFDLATLSGASTELTRLLACCMLQPPVSDTNEICQLPNSVETDSISSPFGKRKWFKFAKSPKDSSYLKSNKFLWNQLNHKESGKVLSPHRYKLLGSSNSRGSPNLWEQLKNNDKRNLKSHSENRMRSKRPPRTEMNVSQLPFPCDTPFRQLPSDDALSLRDPLFIPVRELNRVIQKKSFNEMRDEPNVIKTTDVPVKILNLM